MRVTQLQVARMVGLDVSSVNKILNRRKGPVFKKETVDRVFKVARQLGYDFGRETKGSLAGRVEALEAALRMTVHHIPEPMAKEIKNMLYGKRRAATA
jgi:DNA-binding LacI/PurR family transcriptional regulator